MTHPALRYAPSYLEVRTYCAAFLTLGLGLVLRHEALVVQETKGRGFRQKCLNKMMAKPNVEDADIALTRHEAANATRLYRESLDDSEDSGSG